MWFPSSTPIMTTLTFVNVGRYNTTGYACAKITSITEWNTLSISIVIARVQRHSLQPLDISITIVAIRNTCVKISRFFQYQLVSDHHLHSQSLDRNRHLLQSNNAKAHTWNSNKTVWQRRYPKTYRFYCIFRMACSLIQPAGIAKLKCLKVWFHNIPWSLFLSNDGSALWRQ